MVLKTELFYGNIKEEMEIFRFAEHKPSPETLQKFVDSTFKNELKLGVKYLKDNLLKAINETLK